MKRILFILFSFLSFNLFAQVEPANRFRTATGIIESVLGTNFKKDTVTVGGKKTLVYRQPNTDTYHTVSAVNDSLRFQKWKFDTISQVFVSSNLDDVFIDNVVNKATNFINITSTSDTSIYSTVAQANCPALTIAKLDSCNVAYLYMFNCGTGIWELFKTPNIKTNTRTLYVDSKLGNNLKAKKECPTCQFEYPEDAIAYAVANNIENPSIHVSADTFYWGAGGKSYTSGVGVFNKNGGTLTLKQDKAGVFHVNRNGGSFRFLSNLNASTDYYFDLGTIVDDGLAHNLHSFYISNNSTTANDLKGSFILKARKLLYKYSDISTPNNGFRGTIFQGRSKNINIDIDEVESNVPGFVIDGGDSSNVSINVQNYKQYNARMGIGYNSILYTRGARTNSTINFHFKNILDFVNYGTPFLLDFNVSPTIGEAQLTGQNYSIKGYIDNYTRFNQTNAYASRKGLGTFDDFSTDAFIGIWNRLGIPSTTTNCNYFIEANNVDEYYPIVNNSAGIKNQTIINSTIYIKVNNAKSKSTCISLSGWTLVNSKIIIEGNYTSDSTKCVSIFQNTLDATSSIQLKGKFKTTSPTLEAIEVGNNSGAGVNNIIIEGQIITGGGYSIDNPLGTPVNIIVKPGCASNVTTSANITQLGTGIYVDPNFNN